MVTVTVCFTDRLSQNYHCFAYVRLQLLVITIVYIVDISSDDFISCVLRLSIDLAEKRGIISGSSYSPGIHSVIHTCTELWQPWATAASIKLPAYSGLHPSPNTRSPVVFPRQPSKWSL
jgi:hypothetical protein